MKERLKKEILIGSVLLILLVLGFFFDLDIASFFSTHKNSYISLVMELISAYAFLIPLFVIIGTLLFIKNKKKGIKFFSSLGISLIFVYIIKFIVHRERPFPFSLERNSFPSNHTASAFSVLPIFKRKSRIIWLIFSFLVAFSRIYLSRHYLTDVISGAILGYCIGFIIDLVIDTKFTSRKSRKI